jgi:hypothetical protein
LLLRAEKADTAIKYYMTANMWDDVMRLVAEFAPHKQDEYMRLRLAAVGGGRGGGGGGNSGGGGIGGAYGGAGGGGGGSDRFISDVEQTAHQYEQAGRFDDAVTEYLRVEVSRLSLSLFLFKAHCLIVKDSIIGKTASPQFVLSRVHQVPFPSSPPPLLFLVSPSSLTPSLPPSPPSLASFVPPLPSYALVAGRVIS